MLLHQGLLDYQARMKEKNENESIGNEPQLNSKYFFMRHVYEGACLFSY